MSNANDKFKHSKRLLKDENAVHRQQKIAKSHGIEAKEPHRYTKHHAMDCGNPKCMMCGNPRKVFKELTAQEKKLFQDLDLHRNTHSNGIGNEKDIL